MAPIFITALVTAPIIALGTWLYLRRRSFSSRTRIVLMVIVFLFALFSGPAILLMWPREATDEFLDAGRGGRKLLGQMPFLWLMAVLGTGFQLFRLCRRKGEL